MERRRKEIYSGLFFIALAIVYFAGTYTIKLFSAFEVTVLTSASIPRVLAAMLFILGVIQVVTNVQAAKGDKTGQSIEKQTESNPSERQNKELDVSKELAEAEKNEENSQYHYKDIVLTVLFLVVYLVIMSEIGFIAATFVYLVAQIVLMTKKVDRKKKLPRILILSAVVAAVIYYLFSGVFGLILPTGLLEF
ncbi:tripartite tricarboxylate transporter TctB family protein [Acidaminococcus timonensis]|jgi:heme A synthase|uniref:tripartite tricarboxylate transporter TctB family protein n=1 Tax=Acidaminococcus TaxID=904 RepID=UPI003A5BD9FE